MLLFEFFYSTSFLIRYNQMLNDEIAIKTHFEFENKNKNKNEKEKF